MKPPVTKEEKALVKHLSKKSKNKRVNVYFNKKKSDGSSRYLTGTYFSKKNNKEVTYRSSYELRFYHILESDPTVLSYEVESIKIPYICPEGKSRNYIPDVIVMYNTGNIEICEIKPKFMLRDATVTRKANACGLYFYNLLKDSEVKHRYRFVVEEDLFETRKDYTDFLKTYS